MSRPITYWSRTTGREETEKVYGERPMELLYGTAPGRVIEDSILSRAWVSKAYGAYNSSTFSVHKIEPFIREFDIPMYEFEQGPFRSFNDFFIRKFIGGARPFETRAELMPAVAEARYLGWDRIAPDQTFPVKGEWLSSRLLLGSAEKGRPFENGPLLIARLCPVDYHRFHFPDDGREIERYALHGRLHSVNPRALQARGDIFVRNERQVSILETANFGKIAYIEVGALCVGRIVQTHPMGEPFRRGAEKGYFLFGASTVIVAGEPGRWRPSEDILRETSRRREVLVRLGEEIGRRNSAVPA